MTYESSSAASDVSLALFGLRIIRAMQPSAARGEQLCAWRSARPTHSNRRDPDVAIAVVRSASVRNTKAITSGMLGVPGALTLLRVPD